MLLLLFLCVCVYSQFHEFLKGYFNIKYKNFLLCVYVCVFILVVLQEGLITEYTIHLIIALVSCLPWVCA